MVLRVWGTAISGAGHAVVLGLAIWALPWLRARPGPVVPVVLVRLVDPAELLPPAPPPPPPLVPAAPVSTVRPEATVPHPEIPEEIPVEEGLAGRFDPAAPLGFQTSGAVAPDPAVPMEPQAGETPPEPLPEVEPAGVEAFGAAVLAAVQAAKVTPPIARQRGLFGTTRVSLRVGPAGEVVEVRVVQSSGAKALDDAALKAVRNARLPAPPWGAPVAYDLGISFTLRDN